MDVKYTREELIQNVASSTAVSTGGSTTVIAMKLRKNLEDQDAIEAFAQLFINNINKFEFTDKKTGKRKYLVWRDKPDEN